MRPTEKARPDISKAILDQLWESKVKGKRKKRKQKNAEIERSKIY